jgi:hypothetical protein
MVREEEKDEELNAEDYKNIRNVIMTFIFLLLYIIKAMPGGL